VFVSGKPSLIFVHKVRSLALDGLPERYSTLAGSRIPKNIRHGSKKRSSFFGIFASDEEEQFYTADCRISLSAIFIQFCLSASFQFGTFVTNGWPALRLAEMPDRNRKASMTALTINFFVPIIVSIIFNLLLIAKNGTCGAKVIKLCFFLRQNELECLSLASFSG